MPLLGPIIDIIDRFQAQNFAWAFQEVNLLLALLS